MTTAQLAQQYADALMHASAIKRADEASLTQSLITHLRAKGRMKLLPAIARALRARVARTTAATPRVEVARESERAEALAAAKTAGINATEVVVNDALIRGWRARSASALVDHSAKRSLVELYQRITNA